MDIVLLSTGDIHALAIVFVAILVLWAVALVVSARKV